MTIAALGVVFGDIGTSPLYALHAVFSADGQALRPTEAAVLGVISLVFWTLTIVVTVKYVGLIMRADNEGEGGIMALIALVSRSSPSTRGHALVIGLGILGAALFYGDGAITPAISVLSAAEGLEVADPSLGSFVVPGALAVLTVLFAVQRYGTTAVGRLFGPVMTVWFAVIALAGLAQVVEHPGIARALSPVHGATFLLENRGAGFVVLGAVLLTVTGAEALYADLGHFGRRPIRQAWLLMVFPALTLSYLGQGALILDDSAGVANPFFLLVPHWARLPLVALATVATVIASQAVISGAFSITHQALRLGFLPRLTVRHTSELEAGQVYVPAVNWALYAAVCVLVVGFGSSTRLASAYGIAVAGTMTITTVLFFYLARTAWRASSWVAAGGAAAFLTVDLALFSASLAKVGHGGWVPLGIAVAMFTILTTWRTGHELVVRGRRAEEGPLARFVEEVRGAAPPVHRAPGTAAYLHGDRATAPLALRANVRFNHILHEAVVIVLIETTSTPHVDPADGVVVDDLGYRDDGITHVTARFGYLDVPDVPRALARAHPSLERGAEVDGAFYVVSRITIVRTAAPGMRPWRKRLLVALWRIQADPVHFFRLPERRTVIIGSLIEF